MTESAENRPRLLEHRINILSNFIGAIQFYEEHRKKIEDNYYGKFVAILDDKIDVVETAMAIPHYLSKGGVVIHVPLSQDYINGQILIMTGKHIPFPKTRKQANEN